MCSSNFCTIGRQTWSRENSLLFNWFELNHSLWFYRWKDILEKPSKMATLNVSPKDIDEFFILTTAFADNSRYCQSSLKKKCLFRPKPTSNWFICRNDIEPNEHYQLYTRAVLYYELSSAASFAVHSFKRHAVSIYYWGTEIDLVGFEQ